MQLNKLESEVGIFDVSSMYASYTDLNELDRKVYTRRQQQILNVFVLLFHLSPVTRT